MSSPMSSVSVQFQNNSPQQRDYPDPLGFDQTHQEGFTGNISMNLSHSMDGRYATHQTDASAIQQDLMMEPLPFHHQTPPGQYTQQLNQVPGHPMILPQPEKQVPAAQPPQQGVGEDAIVLQFDRLQGGRGNPRLRWTQELHDRFLLAVSELGDLFSVKPVAVRKKMNVEGLTSEHVRSHLQRCRDSTKKSNLQGIQNIVNSPSPQLSEQGSSSTSRSTTLMTVYGKGLESSQGETHGNGKVLLPNYESDHDESVLIPNYFREHLFDPTLHSNVNSTNFGI